MVSRSTTLKIQQGSVPAGLEQVLQKLDVMSGPRIKFIKRCHLGVALHIALQSHNQMGIKHLQDQSLMAFLEGGISRSQFLVMVHMCNMYTYG